MISEDDNMYTETHGNTQTELTIELAEITMLQLSSKFYIKIKMMWKMNSFQLILTKMIYENCMFPSYYVFMIWGLFVNVEDRLSLPLTDNSNKI